MDIKKKLLHYAYILDASSKYKEYKKIAYEFLADNSSLKKRYFDYFMIFLVLSSILILILETKHKLPSFVYVYENFVVLIFVIEWLGRFWISSNAHTKIIELHEKYEQSGKDASLWLLVKYGFKQKFDFVKSPMSIIDILAILPSFRSLRFLRFFLFFRLFKVFRYTQNLNFLLKVFIEKKFEFLTLLVFFAFMVFFASTVIYIFEGDGSNSKINSFIDAIYWAVITITTVGYGDIAPQTNEGRFVTMFLILGGVSLISFLTSIITTSMTAKLEEAKSFQLVNDVSKLDKYILICGYGKMGEVLADELSHSKEKVVILDINDEQIQKAKTRGLYALKADASDISILKDLRVGQKAKFAIVLTDDDALNLSIVLSIRFLNPDMRVFSRVNESDAKDKLEMAGAEQVIFPHMVAGKSAVEYFQKPISFSAIDKILLEKYNPIVDEVDIGSQSRAKNRTLNNIGLKKHSLKILGVVRGEDKKLIFNPKPDEFTLVEGDILLVIGDRNDVALFKLDLFKG